MADEQPAKSVFDALDPLTTGDPPRPPTSAQEAELMQRQIDALFHHGRQVAAQIHELNTRVIAVETRQQAAEMQLRGIAEDIRLNTEITSQVRDIITAGRVVKRAGDGVGWIAKTVALIAAAGVAVVGWIKALGSGPPTP